MHNRLAKRPVFWVDWSGPHPAIRLWGRSAVGIPITFGTAKHRVRERMGAKYKGPWMRHGVSNLRIDDVVQQERMREESPEQIWALLSDSPSTPVRRRYLSQGHKGPEWAYRYERRS